MNTWIRVTLSRSLSIIYFQLKCKIWVSQRGETKLITARIRRMGEGNVFSLFTSGGGGTRIP